MNELKSFLESQLAFIVIGYIFGFIQIIFDNKKQFIIPILSVGFGVILGVLLGIAIDNQTISVIKDVTIWNMIATLANVFLVIGTGTGLYIAYRELRLLEIEKIHKYRDQYVKIRDKWFEEERKKTENDKRQLTEEEEIKKGSPEPTVLSEQDLIDINLVNLTERVCKLVDMKLLDEEIVLTSFERVVIQNMEQKSTKKLYDAAPEAYTSTRKIYKKWK